ncbi:MAG: STAS domain-containing protein [Desulfobacterales bacterium]|jgi:anti-anti-sigma factor
MSYSAKYVASDKISGTKLGGRVVLAPESSITYENCSEIEKRIEDAIQQNKTEIIIDFKRVEFLDSAALEMLLQAHAEFKSNGGTLKIVGLNEVCRDILLTTRIVNMLFVYEDINEAIVHKP